MVELSTQRAWIVTLLMAANGYYFLSKYKSKNRSFVEEGISLLNLPEVVCFSPTRLAVPLEHLSCSTAIMVLICAVSHCLRKGIEQHVSDSLIRILLQEAVAAADLCGCCFELIIVADNFGVWMYGLYLFFLTIWWSKDWGDANACPNLQLEGVILGKQDTQMSLTKIWAQLTGGVFVFKLIQYIWSLELVTTHENRALEDCTADLQVSIWHGFLVEGGGTFLCQLASKFIADLEPKYGSVIESFIATSLVIAASNWTGGYYNPALASALKYGCSGNTFQEHVLVYWVGACLGSVLSVLVYHYTPMRTIVQKCAGIPGGQYISPIIKGKSIWNDREAGKWVEQPASPVLPGTSGVCQNRPSHF